MGLSTQRGEPIERYQSQRVSFPRGGFVTVAVFCVVEVVLVSITLAAFSLFSVSLQEVMTVRHRQMVLIGLQAHLSFFF